MRSTMHAIEVGQVYAVERDGVRHLTQALSVTPDKRHWRCDDGRTYLASVLVPATEMERTGYLEDNKLRDRLLTEAHTRRG
jgi:hypothetical protein